MPLGIAGFETQTGRSVFETTSQAIETKGRRRFRVPMSDPVLADGLLYFMQWNCDDNVLNGKNRRLSLVCYDPRRQQQLWDSTIAEAGSATDVQGNLSEVAVAGDEAILSAGIGDETMMVRLTAVQAAGVDVRTSGHERDPV